jgi:hypothetical protein
VVLTHEVGEMLSVGGCFVAGGENSHHWCGYPTSDQ